MKHLKREYLAFQLCTVSWLIGWFLKYKFYGPYLSNDVFIYPIISKQFPSFFLSPNVSFTAYYLPLLCIFGIFFQRRIVYIFMSSIMLISTLILGLHINTYNDMTFVTSFWVALWLFWYAFHINNQDIIVKHAPILAKCIIALLFLGGTAGKLTPEYWSGEVFHKLVVLQTPGSIGKFLSTNYSIDQQKLIMSILSKIMIISEGMLILSPFYPYKLFCILTTLTTIMIVLFRSWQILSVLSCLLGMALVCLFIIKHTEKKLHPNVK